jgi:ribosomal protein L13E
MVEMVYVVAIMPLLERKRKKRLGRWYLGFSLEEVSYIR